jgi:hypothetical protein
MGSMMGGKRKKADREGEKRWQNVLSYVREATSVSQMVGF